MLVIQLDNKVGHFFVLLINDIHYLVILATHLSCAHSAHQIEQTKLQFTVPRYPLHLLLKLLKQTHESVHVG